MLKMCLLFEKFTNFTGKQLEKAKLANLHFKN